MWRIDNPFGSINDITSIQFTALKGTCAPGLKCNNQSDFTFVQLQYQATPEPGTLLLLGTGLGVFGIAGRRRAKRSRA